MTEPEVWSAAPPEPARTGTRGRYDWDAIVKKIKRRPGQWYLVDKAGSRGLKTAIDNRKMSALKDPKWDFRSRTTEYDAGTNTCKVWIQANKREVGT